MSLGNQVIPIKDSNVHIYCIKDYFVNMFVIKFNNQLACIDTGFCKSNIRKGFNEFNLDFNQVTHVFLTHSDFDHIANLAMFKRAIIFVSRNEEELIKRKKLRSFFNIFCQLIKNYIFLQNNNTVNINRVPIKTIYTPGHTCGSVSLLLNNSILFTGDAIALKKGKAKPFYNIFNMNTNELKLTMNILSKINNINLLITSHTGYTDNYDYAMDEWR